MIQVYTIMRKIAETTASVLIEARNGTGTKSIARALYQKSSRRDHPFVTVD